MTPLLPCGILAFGLPRPCLLKSNMAYHPASNNHHRATITLADIGFPPTIWDRVGVEGISGGGGQVAAIWGAGLLVDLERSLDPAS